MSATDFFPDVRVRVRPAVVTGPTAFSDGLTVPEVDVDGPTPPTNGEPPYRRRAVFPPSGHLYRPRRGEERKATIRNRGLASRLLKLGESASELQDFIDALYEALPQRVKQRASMDLPSP